MTFAPFQQVAAAITALTLHGVEFPAVPTRFRVEAEDTMYIDVDLSSLSNIQRDQLRGAIPAEFEDIQRAHPTLKYVTHRYMGSVDLVTTRVYIVLHHDREQYLGLI